VQNTEIQIWIYFCKTTSCITHAFGSIDLMSKSEPTAQVQTLTAADDPSSVIVRKAKFNQGIGWKRCFRPNRLSRLRSCKWIR